MTDFVHNEKGEDVKSPHEPLLNSPRLQLLNHWLSLKNMNGHRVFPMPVLFIRACLIINVADRVVWLEMVFDM